MTTKTKINERAKALFRELAGNLPVELRPVLAALERTHADLRQLSSTLKADLDRVEHERNLIADRLSTANAKVDQQRHELERLRQLLEQERLRSQRLESLLEKAALQNDDCLGWFGVSINVLRTLFPVLDDHKQIEVVRRVRDVWIAEIKGEIGPWISREVVAEFVARIDTAIKASTTVL